MIGHSNYFGFGLRTLNWDSVLSSFIGGFQYHRCTRFSYTDQFVCFVLDWSSQDSTLNIDFFLSTGSTSSNLQSQKATYLSPLVSKLEK